MHSQERANELLDSTLAQSNHFFQEKERLEKELERSKSMHLHDLQAIDRYDKLLIETFGKLNAAQRKVESLEKLLHGLHRVLGNSMRELSNVGQDGRQNLGAGSELQNGNQRLGGSNSH